MLVLGIETTCDETSFAVVRNGRDILSHLISSQVDLHRRFGGVVPELACRRHIEAVTPLLHEVFIQANTTLAEIDLIAVAKGPGLIGALLIGINFAKGLAFGSEKPLVGINHIEAHLYAAMMSVPPEALQFPALGVVLSGGHTSLVLIHGIGTYQLIGETIDDAIGEAFDKVAKVLDLPYPGGPEIERLAIDGDPKAFAFKPSVVKEQPYAFSFSGLKTSVLYAAKGKGMQRREALSLNEKRNIAASFQRAALQDVLQKLRLAVQAYPGVKGLFFGGGVTQNKQLRTMVHEVISLPTYWPQPRLSMDNAAMIAGLGYHQFMRSPNSELLTLEPETRIPFQY